MKPARVVPILSPDRISFHRGTRGRFTLAAVALLASCATPPQGVQITVSEEKAAQCQAHGGCGLLSLAQLRQMLQRAHDEGAAEAMEDLDSHGCRRGAT